MVSAEEQAQFLEAVDGVTPLAARDRVPVPRPQPRVIKASVLPPEVPLQAEVDGYRYAARAPGVSHAQIADLRRGRVRIDQTLDLHGERIEPGLARMRAFLLDATRLGLRTVLVIHGKGTHSDHGAPLREAVIGELLGGCSGLIHAFASATPREGGEGATCVVLRGER